MTFFTDRSPIKIHISLVSRGRWVSTRLALLKICLVHLSHQKQISGHLLGRGYMLLGLVLLRSIQCNVGDTASGTSDPLDINIVPILKQSSLVLRLVCCSKGVLLAEAWSQERLVHARHLDLVQLVVVWSSFHCAFLLQLSNVLGLLHWVEVV